MNTTLVDLSLSDLLLLTNQEDKPILASAPIDHEAFRWILDLICGRRHWYDVAHDALRAKSDAEAFRARARSLRSAEQIPGEIESELRARWAALTAETEALRARALDLPSKNEALAFGFAHEVEAIQRECGTVAAPEENAPDEEHAVAGFLEDSHRLRRLAETARELRELISEVSNERRERLITAVRRAATVLTEDAKINSALAHLETSAVVVGLRALPELLAQYEVELLEKLGDPTSLADEAFLRELSARTSSPAQPERRAISPFIATDAVVPPVRLSAVSQQHFAAEKPAPRGIEDVRDLARTLEQFRLIVADDELGSRWMRVARATTHPQLARLV